MNRDPCMRFFGIQSTAPSHELLDVAPGERAEAVIAAALQRRLDRIYRHPAARSREAEFARRVLREAAQHLKTQPPPSPNPASPSERIPAARRAPAPLRAATAHRLSPFDRSVLAVLVANGGWNRQSRTRLAALAARQGVTSEGLLRVLRGLSVLAREGGASFRVADFAPGLSEQMRDREMVFAERMTEITRRIAPEIAARDAWSLTKLSALVLLVAVFFVVVLLRAMVADPVPVIVDEGPILAGPDLPADAGTAPEPVSLVRLAPFRSYPTFRGAAPPERSAREADRAAELVARLSDLERQLALERTVSRDAVSEWSELTEAVANGWILTSQMQRSELRRGMIRVMAETAGRPEAVERFLAMLIPPATTLLEPGDIYRGAWLAGMLAELGSSGGPPYLVETARAHLAAALRRPSVPMSLDFAGGADLWLDAAATALLERLEIDRDAENVWESWLAAQHRIGPPERVQRVMTNVIERVLSGSADLTREGPTTRLLGRLILEADFGGPPVVQEAFDRWLSDTEAISDADLWVLTTLMVKADVAPWFGETFVVMPGEPVAARQRTRERAARAWPRPDLVPARELLPPPDVPRELLDRWASLASRLQERSQLPATEGSRLLRLQHVTHLMAINAAADGLFSGDLPGSIRMIELAEVAVIDERTFGGTDQQLRGDGRTAVPHDGEWARRYAAARGMDDRRMLIEDLEDAARTGIGPRDAALFAELMLRAPTALRGTARRVYQMRLYADPAIVVALLDHFHLVRPDDSDLYEVILQSSGSPGAVARGGDEILVMRRMLAEHAARLLDPEIAELDRIGQVLAEIIAYHLAVAGSARVIDIGLTDVFEGVTRLAEMHLRRLERRMSGSASGAEESSVRLRRSRTARLALCATPMEVFAAEQLTVLSATAALVRRERPHAAREIGRLLDDAVAARLECDDLMQQMMVTQGALIEIMRIRLAIGALIKEAAS